jgi:hypothetical protein
MHRFRRIAVSLFLLCLAFRAPAQDTFTNVQRIVAFGDLHGDYNRLLELLHTANLIDARNAWSGGSAHLVLDGDMVDRGPASRQVLDFVMALQEQAARAGGAVHPLIGNHEAMNVIGDLRYVSQEDWASYRTPDSKKLLDDAAKAALEAQAEQGNPPSSSTAFIDRFVAGHPLGWVEQRLLWAPTGKYGQWIRKQKAVIRIDDTIFMHAGIPPKYATQTREQIDREVLEALDDPSKLSTGVITNETGPLWYRDLVTGSESQAELAANVDRILKTQEARRIVVGHTVVPAIMPRFDGKVVAIDVGLSDFFKGPPAFLVIEGSQIYAIHRGHRFDIPTAGGAAVTQYLRAVFAVDPNNAPLRKLLDSAR